MDWYVEVEGDEDILEDLTRVCRSPGLTFERDGTKFLLRSSDLSSCEPSAGVYREGRRLLKIISGTLRFASSLRKPLEITRVIGRDSAGKVSYNYELCGEVICSGKLVGVITHPDGTVEELSELAHVSQWVDAALLDNNIAQVLEKIAVGPLGIKELYVIFEDIKGTVGTAINSWVGQHEIKRFKQSAQIERHGKSYINESWRPHKRPMTVHEARAFIETLMTQWIRSKHVKTTGG